MSGAATDAERQNLLDRAVFARDHGFHVQAAGGVAECVGLAGRLVTHHTVTYARGQPTT